MIVEEKQSEAREEAKCLVVVASCEVEIFERASALRRSRAV